VGTIPIVASVEQAQSDASLYPSYSFLLLLFLKKREITDDEEEEVEVEGDEEENAAR